MARCLPGGGRSRTVLADAPDRGRLKKGALTVLPIRTILHPTDFSEQSRPAFNLACALARDYGAALFAYRTH
jgi:hypothetical protein